MNFLEERIQKDGIVKEGNVLKVDSFLNHQMDISLFEKMGEEFPQEPRVQLMEAVKAVFRSWDNERAIVYRRMNDIPGDWGTAVNVQSMVFGNMGNTSGTGVAFTRNPSTGAKGIYGEYLINARVRTLLQESVHRSPLPDWKKTCRNAMRNF